MVNRYSIYRTVQSIANLNLLYILSLQQTAKAKQQNCPIQWDNCICSGLSCVAASVLRSLKLLKPRRLVSLWLKEMGESELGTMVMSSKCSSESCIQLRE